MRPLIAEIVEQLTLRHETTSRVDLNDIAEIIGTRAVSYEEVEQIIAELETRGCSVGGPPTAREMALLGEVLAAARTLRAKLERKPTVAEIAEEAAQPAFVVRRALENASAMGKKDEPERR